ncbi:hypothetical protein [Methylococcus sp. Mc7]|uniref:hypothetical protein n=1 Tax=Methylococcus sp. Mc7 TaxID=2860258 RepID=UPI001C5274A8|nr:hypothetical protein [Methylococcus sp. Mc7]QXP84980.1 hypothetical protein KW115_04385 [Methylococcus sp. Mc7]
MSDSHRKIEGGSDSRGMLLENKIIDNQGYPKIGPAGGWRTVIVPKKPGGMVRSLRTTGV